MEYWLKSKLGDIQFPVPPSEFEVSFGSLNKTVNVLNFGEISLLGEVALRSWSIEGFFPAQHYSFCQCTPKEPYEYCKLIDQIKTSKTVCRFIATGTRLNNACSVEEFNYGEKDGTGDIYFSINFKEHKTIKLETRGTATGAAKAKVNARPTIKTPVKTYTVKAGDTLSAIAKRVYGDSSKYTEIAKKNNLKNPNVISVGQVLYL